MDNSAYRNTYDIDDTEYAIERIARVLQPKTQKYYESTEGKTELTAQAQSEEKLTA